MTNSIRFYDRAIARLSRRELLKVAWALGLTSLGHAIRPPRTLAQPIFNRYPFSLGVASGDPLPDGVVLWTRLAPEPLEGGGMPMANVDVAWEIASDSRFNTVVQ
jgi:alkaline phosphatase D